MKRFAGWLLTFALYAGSFSMGAASVLFGFHQSLYFMITDGRPNTYGPKPLWYWRAFIGDLIYGMEHGSKAHDTILFLNSDTYSNAQFWEWRTVMARRSPSNPQCNSARFCTR